jgi:hypothetical protein
LQLPGLTQNHYALAATKPLGGRQGLNLGPYPFLTPLGKGGSGLQILQAWGRGYNLAASNIKTKTDPPRPCADPQQYLDTGHVEAIAVLKALLRLRLATKKHHGPTT